MWRKHDPEIMSYKLHRMRERDHFPQTIEYTSGLLSKIARKTTSFRGMQSAHSEAVLSLLSVAARCIRE
jgi:hypothetical protein